MDKEIKKIKKTILTVSLLVLFFLFIFFFLFWQVEVKNNKIHILESEIEYYSQRDSRLRNVELFARNLNLEFDVLDQFFLPADHSVYFIEEVERLGRELDLSVKTSFVGIEGVSREVDDFKEYLKINIETEGDRVPSFEFLSFLENLPYHIVFNQVSIRKVSQDGSSDLWRGSFEFKLLKFK